MSGWRLFDPDLFGHCWHCGERVDAQRVPASRAGWWAHDECQQLADAERAQQSLARRRGDRRARRRARCRRAARRVLAR